MRTPSHLRFVKTILEGYVKTHEGQNKIIAKASVNTLAYALEEDPVYSFEDFSLDTHETRRAK